MIAKELRGASAAPASPSSRRNQDRVEQDVRQVEGELLVGERKDLRKSSHIYIYIYIGVSETRGTFLRSI